jgi:hypothetical protein
MIIRVDGRPACSKCGKPVTQTRGRNGTGRPQSYCDGCRAEFERNRRAGKIQVLLTPEEWAAVKAMRAVAGGRGGRHRR